MILLLAALTIQEPARNPHAVQPERPTVATHAHTVATGWLEFELGGEYDRFDDGSHGFVAPLTAKLGVTDHMQLTVQTGLNSSPGVSLGVGDASVGIKWRLLDDAPLLGDFAILPSIKLPTGSAPHQNNCFAAPCPPTMGTGTGTTDFGILLISSHMLGPVSMDLNVGYTRRSGNGTFAPLDATVWTASFGGPVTEEMGWTVELFGRPTTSGLAGQGNIMALLFGPTFSVSEWLAADLGAIAPLTGPQPKAVYAGMTINVGQVFR